MRRFAALLFSLLLLFSALTSCAREESAEERMRAFADAYGGGTVYSPSIPEGESGHADDTFYEDLFGAQPYEVEDYAVLLLPSLESGGEAGIFLCYTAADAMEVEEICLRRTELVRRVGALSSHVWGEDAFVERYGRKVVYAALPDAARARRLLRSLFS